MPTPSNDALPPPDSESPTTTAPANDTASPASRRRGKPSRSSQPPSTAMTTGPMLTTIAAVPASTCRSPQLSVTMYPPNHSTPVPAMPGQAARGGQPSPRASQTAPRTREPASSRPRASAPGSKYCPASRIATNADAQATRVTDTAASARRSSPEPGRALVLAGTRVFPRRLTGTETRPGTVQLRTKYHCKHGRCAAQVPGPLGCLIVDDPYRFSRGDRPRSWTTGRGEAREPALRPGQQVEPAPVRERMAAQGLRLAAARVQHRTAHAARLDHVDAPAGRPPVTAVTQGGPGAQASREDDQQAAHDREHPLLAGGERFPARVRLAALHAGQA